MTTFQKVSLAVLATVLIVLGITVPKTMHESAGALQAETPALNFWVSETATSGIIALGSQVRLVASSSSRHWLTFSAGQGCLQGFYISLANDAPATASNSIFVASSTMFEINPTVHTYNGAVRAVSNGGTCNVITVGY